MKKILCSFFVMICLHVAAQQHVIKTFNISGIARWDYISAGPLHDWLYVSHGTQVNVLNKLTGDSVAVIPNTTGVHGIAFDAAHKKGFISNGKINSVTVFDLNTNKVLDQIAAGKDPDAIFYEPFSKKIITCNGDGANISIIDPVTDKVVDSVDVGGDPETAVSDGEGKIFINLEDKSEIVTVDAKTFKVLNHFSIAPGKGPTGLSIDADTKRLFAGCRNLLMIMNAENSTVTDSIPIGKGCDGTAFDTETKMIYASCGDGTITAVHEDNANKFTVAETITTKRGARTLALDKDTHHLYLPTAEYEPMQPGQTGRPKTKDGTFQILVVGK